MEEEANGYGDQLSWFAWDGGDSWEVSLSVLKPRKSWENWDELVNRPVVRILGGEVEAGTVVNFPFGARGSPPDSNLVKCLPGACLHLKSEGQGAQECSGGEASLAWMQQDKDR